MTVTVFVDRPSGKVVTEFSQPTAWFALTPDEAEAYIRSLTEKLVTARNLVVFG